MSGLTKIEWADAIWNPVTGCTKVSAGCTNCYAERQAKRFAGRFGYPAEHPFAVTLHAERLDEPLRWRKPRRIFVCSMSDLFHERVPNAFVEKVLAICAEASWHQFLILTKRAERMAHWLTSEHVQTRIDGKLCSFVDDGFRLPAEPRGWDGTWPLPNVWLGVSIEDQATADERIPHLLQCPAAVRFVSYEPALGPVGLHSLALSGAKPSGFIDALGNQSGEFSFQSHRIGDLPSLDWVIAGGESGPKARPAHPDWFRSVRDQCQAAGVPFFFKQWGGTRKKLTGRALDGRTWDQFPKSAATG
jgi:protein gp37